MERHSALLVGCGSRAQIHAQALAESDRFELTAVCDLDRPLAEETADEYGVPSVYEDFEAALSAESPTHVSIVMPAAPRVGVAKATLRTAPPSVLVEKPVANTLEDVLDIAALADATGTRVTVSHQWPWSEELRALKGWIDDGRLGEVTRLIASTKLGLALEGTHVVHLLDWLLGDRPERVYGWASGAGPLEGVSSGHVEPGDAVYELSYPGGSRAFAHQGSGAPDVPEQSDRPWLEVRVDALGTDGCARFVLGDHASGVFTDGEEFIDAPPFESVSGDAYMTRGFYDDLADVLSGDRVSHLGDLSRAVSAHRTLDAVMRSTVEGRPVAPAENPPDLGRSTPERLRRHLLARTPIVVSTAMFRGTSREAALDSLAELGIHRVELWGGGGVSDGHVDPADPPESLAGDLSKLASTAPLLSVPVNGPVVDTIAYAADSNADTVVIEAPRPNQSSDGIDADRIDADRIDALAQRSVDAGVTIALRNGPDGIGPLDTVVDLLGEIDSSNAGVALRPTASTDRHDTLVGAVVRLGDRIEVAYLRDREPGTPDDPPGDSQVPGGGGAVDFERYLGALLEHAPDAHWVLRYGGTGSWESARIERSVRRSLRFLETQRPGSPW